jgi:hypothetical protein
MRDRTHDAKKLRSAFRGTDASATKDRVHLQANDRRANRCDTVSTVDGLTSENRDAAHLDVDVFGNAYVTATNEGDESDGCVG